VIIIPRRGIGIKKWNNENGVPLVVGAPVSPTASLVILERLFEGLETPEDRSLPYTF